EWVKPERQRVDLRCAPMMRLQIAADPRNDTWYALLQVHHITCDHVTTEAIVSEVIERLRGEHRSFPDSIPYRNHVAAVLAAEEKLKSEAYFRDTLGDLDETT